MIEVLLCLYDVPRTYKNWDIGIGSLCDAGRSVICSRSGLTISDSLYNVHSSSEALFVDGITVRTRDCNPLVARPLAIAFLL